MRGRALGELAVFSALTALLVGGGVSPLYGATAGSLAGPGEVNVFVSLSRKIIPSVVNISTVSTMKVPPGMGGPDDLFRRFFEDFFRRNGGGIPGGPGRGGEEEDGDQDEGVPPHQQPGPNGNGRLPKAMSLGTGFVIEPGLILTNNHVVGEADEIKISFTEDPNEKPTDGEVTGRDPELDIALIKVKTSRKVPSVVLGDSDALEVGEYVIAVGNPFGQGHSVTHGIISAKGRFAPDFPLATYIQTDAPINPGNSGGPLVNLKGEVVGINNAIEQRAQGIGFAIPITLVKKVLAQLKSKGSVSRGYIGILVNELTPEVAPKIGVSKELRAPFVTHVYPGEPADKAGIRPYDVLLEFNGKRISSATELIAAVTAVEVGQTIPVKISRGGKEMELSLKVSQRPGASRTAEQQAPGGSKKEKKPARIETGMTLETLTPEIARELGMPTGSRGAVVSATAYGGAADRAGMVRGDVILEVDRKPVTDVDSFYSVVKEKKSYLIRVRRADPQGREVFSVIVLDLKG